MISFGCRVICGTGSCMLIDCAPFLHPYSSRDSTGENILHSKWAYQHRCPQRQYTLLLRRSIVCSQDAHHQQMWVVAHQCFDDLIAFPIWKMYRDKSYLRCIFAYLQEKVECCRSFIEGCYMMTRVTQGDIQQQANSARRFNDQNAFTHIMPPVPQYPTFLRP